MSRIESQDHFMASLGVECYRVGGSVRDELRDMKPKDADYMVRYCTMDTLRTKLENAGATGIKTLKLRQGGQFGWRCDLPTGGHVEISLPRTEVSTGEGRAMKVTVDPWLSLEDDAKRRDFTFNALYRQVNDGTIGPYEFMVDDKGGVVLDPTGRGLFDLERRIICTTHPDSFRDDPLRMLRALRFIARGFDLSERARLEMVEHAERVDGLTAHGYTSGTLLDELRKILASDHAAKALRVARNTGVLAAAIPELAPMLGFEQNSQYHDLTTDEHTFEAIHWACVTDAPLRVRFALLFHDSGKPEAAWLGTDGRTHYYANGKEDRVWTHPDGSTSMCLTEDHEVVGVRIWREFCARVNAGRDLREDVATLIKNHMLTASPKPSRVRRMRVKLGDPLLRDLILHRACDLSGKGKPDAKKLGVLKRWEEIRLDAAERGIPASVKDLEVSGRDAMALGYRGAAIGAVLRGLLDEIVCEPSDDKLTRTWQLERLAYAAIRDDVSK